MSGFQKDAERLFLRVGPLVDVIIGVVQSVDSNFAQAQSMVPQVSHIWLVQVGAEHLELWNSDLCHELQYLVSTLVKQSHKLSHTSGAQLVTASFTCGLKSQCVCPIYLRAHLLTMWSSARGMLALVIHV